MEWRCPPSSQHHEKVDLLPQEVRESFCLGPADTIGKSTRKLLPGERERFCQRSVNLRNTCLIGYYSQSIPSEL